MTSFIDEYETVIRLSVFIGVFTLMAILEYCLPRRQRTLPRISRWFTNWALVVIDGLALRLLVPVMAVGVAKLASENGWGLLNWFYMSPIFKILVSVIVLDMLIYWQHVASHRFSLLWRFHKVHHADRDIDVTTGARFHPVEIVLSMIYKCCCIVLIGAPVIAVFVFEITLNASAMFNHSNVKLGSMTDRLIRKVVVTPDMHRVHHSVVVSETNSNFGFFLSIWDRLFCSYVDQPSDGHQAMKIGLSEYQDEQPASLFWSLKIPFLKQ